MNSIQLVITLTSPLHVAYMGGNEGNLTKTVKQTAVVDGATVQIPFFGSNGFRGGLRRYAADRVLNHLVATDGPVPADLYLGLRNGAAPGGSPDKTPLTFEEVIRARKDAYMGLFGGGARLIPSMFAAGDLLPIIQSTVNIGMVPEWTRELVAAKPHKDDDTEARYIGPWEITADRTEFTRDDLHLASDPDGMMKFLSNPLEVTAAYQAQVNVALQTNRDNKAKVKAGEATETDRESVTVGIHVAEAIVPGVQMYVKFTVDPDAGEHQFGLLLHAIRDMIRANRLGGRGRLGFGQYRADQMRVSFGGDESIWSDFYGSGKFDYPAQASRYLSAADTAISEMTIDSLQDYFVDFSAGAKQTAKQVKKSKAAASV